MLHATTFKYFSAKIYHYQANIKLHTEVFCEGMCEAKQAHMCMKFQGLVFK